MLLTPIKMKTQTVGERLRILRNEYNFTSEKLAGIVEMSRQTIDNAEKGVSNLTAKSVEKIATKLGSTFQWLHDGKGEMLPHGKLDIATITQRNQFNSATDTLYLELRDQIEFYRSLLTQMAGGKKSGSFLQALNGTGLSKRSLGAAAA